MKEEPLEKKKKDFLTFFWKKESKTKKTSMWPRHYTC
jgi:hypothetical protein